MNRKEFFALLPAHLSPADRQMIINAYWLAKEGHRTQKRDGGDRYFSHPRAVAALCIKHGFDDPRTIAAALLHDGVEDTYTPLSVYMALLGTEIWEWILALSKKVPNFDPLNGHVIGYVKRDPEQYFAGIMALPAQGRIIKPFDRLHNLQTAGEFALPRMRRYVDETRARIIPISDATEPRVSALLNAALEPLDLRLAA